MVARVILAVVLAVSVGMPCAFASGCGLDELSSYQLVQKKTIKAHEDEAGRGIRGSQAACPDGSRCSQTAPACAARTAGQDDGPHDEMLPMAYIFARSKDDVKICVGDDLYDVAPLH